MPRFGMAPRFYLTPYEFLQADLDGTIWSMCRWGWLEWGVKVAGWLP
jgi:hypothetical protein